MSESIIDLSIERTERQLRNLHVKNALGKAANTLLSLNRSLYIPQVEDGQIIVENDDNIPIVALAEGASITLSGDNTGFSEKQRKRLFELGVGLKQLDHMEDALPDEKIYTLNSYGHAAVVARRGLYKLNGKTGIVTGKPLVVLKKDSPKLTRDNTALPHELVHVQQELSKPIRSETGFTNVQQEVEAYSLEGAIQAALQYGRKPDLTKAHKVMQLHNDYAATGSKLDSLEDQVAFEAALRRHSVGVISPTKNLPHIRKH